MLILFLVQFALLVYHMNKSERPTGVGTPRNNHSRGVPSSTVKISFLKISQRNHKKFKNLTDGARTC